MELDILRPHAWQALLRRLDAAIERDPRLAEARDVVLRPIELLRVMAADAPGALADDVLRADRLRAMLFAAWPYVSIAVEAREVVTSKTHGDAGKLLAALAKDSTWPEPQAYEPGVIDHAGLLVLALAAARVADPPFGPMFVASIQGIALAASAAEVLGRLDPRQPDALEVVLQTLYLIESVRTLTRSETLRPFALDPVERGRWKCLDELLTGELFSTAATLYGGWDGATSDEIVAVQPRTAAPGKTVQIVVATKAALTGGQVVFASADGPLLPVPAKRVSGDDPAVTVTVPATAVPGWIGFSRPDRIDASNAARDGMRKLLGVVLAKPCVDGLGRIDPELALPHFGTLATPRRRGNNRFEGGTPTVDYFEVTPARVRPSAPITVRWECTGATSVELRVGDDVVAAAAPPAGSLDLTAPTDDGEVTITLVPAGGTASTRTVVVATPIRILALAVVPATLVIGQPLAVVATLDAISPNARAWFSIDGTRVEGTLDGARATAKVPAKLVRDGMTITAVVEDGLQERDTRTLGPLTARSPAKAAIVFVRPTIVTATDDANATYEDIDQVSLVDAAQLLAKAALAANLDATIDELPWTDDDLAVLAGHPQSDNDPALAQMLEALARRALVTPGRETAVWLALLPDTDAKAMLRAVELPGLARSAPANAARLVAIATPRGLPRLLAQLADAVKPAPFAQRMAIQGELAARSIAITDVRVDLRGEGPGAPVETKLQAVALDRRGDELARTPIRVLSPNRPAAISALVPISPAVASIELRDDIRTYETIRRIGGSVVLSDISAHGGELTWHWDHTGNARPAVSLTLGPPELATPVLALDPCFAQTDLPLGRYATGPIAIYATDGWNSAEAAVTTHENATPVVVRKFGAGRFFADVPAESSIEWRLDGVPRGTGRTLSVPQGTTGTLQLVAKLGKKTLEDRIRLA
ncbi:MAG: hypothetical protein QM831_26995 [Kofleriaceae bacterium]